MNYLFDITCTSIVWREIKEKHISIGISHILDTHKVGKTGGSDQLLYAIQIPTQEREHPYYFKSVSYFPFLPVM